MKMLRKMHIKWRRFWCVQLPKPRALSTYCWRERETDCSHRPSRTCKRWAPQTPSAPAVRTGHALGLAMRLSLSQGPPMHAPGRPPQHLPTARRERMTQASLRREIPKPRDLPVTAFCWCFRGLNRFLGVQMPVANQYVQYFHTFEKTNKQKTTRTAPLHLHVSVSIQTGHKTHRRPPAPGKAAEPGWGWEVKQGFQFSFYSSPMWIF